MAKVERHNLTFSFVMVCLGLLSVVLGTPNFLKLAEAERIQTASMAPSRAARRQIQNDIAKAAQGSRIPMDLVRANRCIPVVLSDGSGGEVEFTGNVEVVAKTPTGQPIPPGSYVCNTFGKSALVGVDFKLTDIQVTPLEKVPEYQKLYNQMLNLQNRQVIN